MADQDPDEVWVVLPLTAEGVSIACATKLEGLANSGSSESPTRYIHADRHASDLQAVNERHASALAESERLAMAERLALVEAHAAELAGLRDQLATALADLAEDERDEARLEADLAAARQRIVELEEASSVLIYELWAAVRDGELSCPVCSQQRGLAQHDDGCLLLKEGDAAANRLHPEYPRHD